METPALVFISTMPPDKRVQTVTLTSMKSADVIIRTKPVVDERPPRTTPPVIRVGAARRIVYTLVLDMFALGFMCGLRRS